MVKRTLGLTVVLLLAGMLFSACGSSGPSTFEKEQAYNTIKPQIQNSVTVYVVDHNGELPPYQGTMIVTVPQYQGWFEVECYILDICSIVGQGELLRDVPYGCYGDAGEVNTNFYSGDCDNPSEGYYIWVIDSTGNVYSTCVGDDCDANNKDGFQGVWYK